MYRLAVFLLVLFIYSCKNNGPHVKFGCDSPCEEKKWLTFSYDAAYLFQDSSGAIKKSLDSDSLLSYTQRHNVPCISKEDVDSIDEALSCKTWVCNKTVIKKELYNPENIIVFTRSTVRVAWIAICPKSGSVKCQPNSENNEIALVSSVLFFIKNKD